MVACPGCGREVRRSGVVSGDAGPLDVYQCDQCRAEVDMFGVKVEVALTFAVDEEGRAFDPASPDGELPPIRTG